MDGDFALAAQRLQERYYRRFPDAPETRWDATSIKDRWYRNLRRLVAARTRLGKYPVTDLLKAS